jgi:O-antigen ligase
MLGMVLLATLWWGSSSQDAPVWERDTAVFTGILCLWLATAVVWQLVSGRQSGLARVGDIALLFGLCLMLMRLRPNGREVLQAAGAAMSATTLISVVVSAFHGKLEPDANVIFGFGSVTMIGCFATPVLLAWAVLLWKEPHTATRTAKCWCVVGLLALVVVVVMTERRGPVLAALTPLMVWAGIHLWRRSPRLAWLVFVSLATTALVILVPLLIADPGTGRGQRFLLYRVAAILGWEAFPFGHGPFGMLAVDQSSSWSAHLWIARERSALHAHNELLNAWVEGGIVHVAVWLGLMGLLLARIIRCCDTTLRAAFLTLYSVWFTLSMVDNSFGTFLGMAWSGIIFGCIMSLPNHDAPASRGVSPMVRGLMVAAVLLGLGIAGMNWRMALLATDSLPHARLSALEPCRDPVLIQGEIGLLVGDPRAEPPFKALAVQMAHQRLGWTANVPSAAVVVAAAIGDRNAYLRALCRLLARNPFDLKAIDSIRQACERWPFLIELVPPDQQRRLALYAGVLNEPESLSGDWWDFSQSADRLAIVAGALQRGEFRDGHVGWLIELVGKYGQIEDVAVTAIRASALAPNGLLAGLQPHAARLRDGLGTSAHVVRAFEQVAKSGRAHQVLPLLREITPAWISRLEAHMPPHQASLHDAQQRKLWTAIVQVWSSAKRGH